MYVLSNLNHTQPTQNTFTTAAIYIIGTVKFDGAMILTGNTITAGSLIEADSFPFEWDGRASVVSGNSALLSSTLRLVFGATASVSDLTLVNNTAEYYSEFRVYQSILNLHNITVIGATGSGVAYVDAGSELNATGIVAVNCAATATTGSGIYVDASVATIADYVAYGVSSLGGSIVSLSFSASATVSNAVGIDLSGYALRSSCPPP